MLHTVHFQPGNKTVDVLKSTPLVVAATEAGFDLRTECNGAGICGKCEVLVNSEKRLACQVSIDRNLDVLVPATSTRTGEDTIVVRENAFLPDLSSVPSNRPQRFGIALDIGTTTLAAELFEFFSPCGRDTHAPGGRDARTPKFLGVVSRINPQRSFGDDVISRIQKVMEEPDALHTLQECILSAVNEMIAELAQKAGINPAEISLMAVAGNTVMEYLFLGIDPTPLALAPFIPPITDFPACRAGELGLNIDPNGTIETLPVIGGFVGGDIVAGILATGLAPMSAKAELGDHDVHELSEGTVFQIDLGTNGELVLRHEGEFYTAATAAGPVFEGGRIEYGTLAVPGAIDHVHLSEDGTVRCGTIGDRPAMGICGSGLIDAVAELLRLQLIDSRGRFQVKAQSPFISRWTMTGKHPAFEFVPASESGRSEAILLTQRDVRQLQLASGAIRAGIQLLLRRVNVETKDVRTFLVAGGFGSFIRPESARRIGLLPADIDPQRIRFCGNTALAGARLVLFDQNNLEQAGKIARNACSIDLATLPNFSTVFAESMIFE